MITMLLPPAVITGVTAGASDGPIPREEDWRKAMEKTMDGMYWTHCCRCGYRISQSAPGTKSRMICPRCGSELEVRVEGTGVSVDVLKIKEPRAAAAAH